MSFWHEASPDSYWIMVIFSLNHEVDLKVPLCTFSMPDHSLTLWLAHSLKSTCRVDSPTHCNVQLLCHVTYARQHFCSTSLTIDNIVQCIGIGLLSSPNTMPRPCAQKWLVLVPSWKSVWNLNTTPWGCVQTWHCVWIQDCVQIYVLYCRIISVFERVTQA